MESSSDRKVLPTEASCDTDSNIVGYVLSLFCGSFWHDIAYGRNPLLFIAWTDLKRYCAKIDSYPDVRLPPYSEEEVFIQAGADQGTTIIFRYCVTDLISARVDHRYEGALFKVKDPSEESFQVSSKVYAEAERSDAPNGTLITDSAAEEAPSVGSKSLERRDQYPLEFEAFKLLSINAEESVRVAPKPSID